MDWVTEYLENNDLEKFEDENGNTYSIRIIGRGEHLIFVENDKVCVCVIDAVHKVIYSRSVKSWEGQKKMSKGEKERVIELILRYYKIAFNKDATVSDSRL